MDKQQTSNPSITLAQLVAGTWSIPKHHCLRDVRAEDDFGTVRVWSSPYRSWCCVLADPLSSTAPDPFFDLVVQGHPKMVASELVTIQAFDQGLIETPISMTLAQGLNWAHHWDQAEPSEKAELFDQLYLMAGSASRCLNYNRHHFSTVVVEDLLRVIDTAIRERDWPAFVQNIEKLSGLKEMNDDSVTSTFVPEF